jgi:hypothetical protein
MTGNTAVAPPGGERFEAGTVERIFARKPAAEESSV